MTKGIVAVVDAWLLEQHNQIATEFYLAGKQETEQRIIKLLETEKKIYSDPQFSTTGGLIENFVLDNAIALIKGETK